MSEGSELINVALNVGKKKNFSIPYASWLSVLQGTTDVNIVSAPVPVEEWMVTHALLVCRKRVFAKYSGSDAKPWLIPLAIDQARWYTVVDWGDIAVKATAANDQLSWLIPSFNLHVEDVCAVRL